MLASLLFAVALAADQTIAAPPQQIAPGIVLLPGDFPAGCGPDGNTVIYRTPQGLVVLDTGRHAWHSDAILAYAQSQHRPIVAIVNSHWHLDHSSGNIRIKAAYPHAQLYATTAIDRALTGFLADNFRQAQSIVGSASGVQKEEMQLFIDTMTTSASLRPDVPVMQSGPLRIGGKQFDAHVTDHAVTDADIWLYDRSTRVAAVGDLVTLPAPFFETACTARWREALDQVWATPFRIAIPGHGAPMTRDQFNIYRIAFDALADCVSSSTEAATCAASWAQAIAPLVTGDARAQDATRMTAYYVGFLRQHGGNSAECQKP